VGKKLEYIEIVHKLFLDFKIEHDLVRAEVLNTILRIMVSCGMLRCVVLLTTEVSEELSASFIRVIKIGELGTTLAVTSN
jgi:hypothetical protein